MISRRVLAAGLVFGAVCAPAYAGDQPGTSAAAAANANSTPPVERGHFPHRKPVAKKRNGGLILGGAALGGGLLAGLSQAGGGGAAPPVSGQ